MDNFIYADYNVTAVLHQIQELGASWVIINLSAGAFGDVWMAYHPILTELNPWSTYPNATMGGRDLFDELLQAFRSAKIKVIAYVAGQGPALLKNGPWKAHDFDPSTNASASYERWHAYVESIYGDRSRSSLMKAFAEIIMDYYGQTYGHLIDGWWFDQGTSMDIPLVHSILDIYNPDAVFAYNKGPKVISVVIIDCASIFHCSILYSLSVVEETTSK